MSTPNLTTGYAYIRDLLSDGDSVVTDAVLLRHINEAMSEWKGASDDRPRLLTATLSGLTAAAGDKTLTTSLTTIRRVLRVFRATGAGTTTPVSADLEIAEPWEVRSLQRSNSTQDTPTMCALHRLGTDTSADVGKWVFLPWPIPDATVNFVIMALVESAAFTLGTETPDLTDVEAYGIYRVAAARLAPTMGYDDSYIEQIWKGVPEIMQAALRVQEKGKGPRPRPQENPA